MCENFFLLKGISKKFLYEPQSTTARVGSTARFSCQVRHAVPPATVTWQKDGSPLSSGNRVVILDQGVLQIKNVNKADEGNYRCIASNFAKTRYSRAASLTVQTGDFFVFIIMSIISISSNYPILRYLRINMLSCACDFVISHKTNYHFH